MFALDHPAWTIFRMHRLSGFQPFMTCPCPGEDFYIENTRLRMDRDGALARSNFDQLVNVNFYSSPDEAYLESKNTLAQSPTYQPHAGPSTAGTSTSSQRGLHLVDVAASSTHGHRPGSWIAHTRSAVGSSSTQGMQNDGEFYESDLEGSLSSSDCDGEDTARTRAPLLGSLDGVPQQIPFSPTLSAADESEPTTGNVSAEIFFNSIHAEPGWEVDYLGWVIGYKEGWFRA